MKRLLAFDLDGTLTQHKTPLSEEYKRILRFLSRDYKLLIVGAGRCHRIRRQIGDLPVDIIGNYGLEFSIYDEKSHGDIMLRSEIFPVDRESLLLRTRKIRERFGFFEYYGEPLEFHSSGCITLPILGTEARLADKLNFDPTREKRRKIYREVCEAFNEYNVFIGGSSSFDMAPKPYDKRTALEAYCREYGYEISEAVYFGDDYGMGGNDESVYLSEIDFVKIDDYRKTGAMLLKYARGMSLDALLAGIADCECGRAHVCPTKHIFIEDGAIKRLGEIAGNYKNILVVADENTYGVAGAATLSAIGERVYGKVIFGKELLVPNEESIERIDAEITGECDLIVGIGSGVINDLSKYCSHKRGLPYYIVATAPSMDGYASVGAALILGGMKVTENAHVPEAIIADTTVIKNAPMDMIIAGYGDIIGKYSCLNDWSLSSLVRGEYICERVLMETYCQVEKTRAAIGSILRRESEGIRTLTEALVSVGILMAYVGNSRPASGSEHHLSHYFEIVGIERGEDYLPHGLDVFYSSAVTAKIREELAERLMGDTLSPCDLTKDYVKEIRRIYGKRADGVTELQSKVGLYKESAQRFSVYGEKREEIAALLSGAPSFNEVASMLSEAGLDYNDFVKFYGEKKILDGIKYAKDLKDRFTVLWTYGEIY